MAKVGVWSRNRTLLTAIVATLALGALVYSGRLAPFRALVPLCLLWGFAMHILDSRDNTEDHKEAMSEMISHLERAGVEERAGHRAAAAAEMLEVAKEGCALGEDVCAKAANEAKA